MTGASDDRSATGWVEIEVAEGPSGRDARDSVYRRHPWIAELAPENIRIARIRICRYDTGK